MQKLNQNIILKKVSEADLYDEKATTRENIFINIDNNTSMISN